MTVATKDENVTCTNGHVRGSFKQDIVPGAQISGSEFGVDLSHAKIVGAPGAGKYVCDCGADIAVQGADGYQVHTARGWVG